MFATTENETDLFLKSVCICTQQIHEYKCLEKDLRNIHRKVIMLEKERKIEVLLNI